jgi:hypothetical protein
MGKNVIIMSKFRDIETICLIFLKIKYSQNSIKWYNYTVARDCYNLTFNIPKLSLKRGIV